MDRGRPLAWMGRISLSENISTTDEAVLTFSSVVRENTESAYFVLEGLRPSQNSLVDENVTLYIN